MQEYARKRTGTITRDCQWLMRQNTLAAMVEISEHKVRQFSEIQELKRAAWGKEDYGTVIRCFEREAKLLGLDAPLEILTNDFDTQAVADIQAGRVTYESLIQYFDEKEATRLFRMAGKPIPRGKSVVSTEDGAGLIQ